MKEVTTPIHFQKNNLWQDKKEILHPRADPYFAW